ncbi:MAG: aldo/keto reductase [Gemmatimonadales bacterium]|nr:aldo/keto reductase [Gemmatimonadales bacterium]
MRLRPLGPGAPAVSAVGFGGMHLSVQGRPDEEAALRTLLTAFECGVTLVDTADVYCLGADEVGHNERLIARALRIWPGDPSGIVVATKGGMIRPDGRWERDARPERLHRACDRSLRALGVDAIDLYQLHQPDHQVPFEESVGALAELRQAGKIRHVGLSNVTVEQIRRAQAIVPVTAVQNRLNPFFREALETGVVAYCAEHGIGFLAYSPVGGGRLNRTLPAHPVLAPMAAELGVTAHQLVLAWVLAQGSTVLAIPSARSAANARASARAADLVLARADLDRITAASFDRS